MALGGKAPSASQWVIDVLILIVAAVWAANFVWRMYHPDFRPPAEVNIAFSAVCLTTLGVKVLARNGNGGGTDGG